MTFYYDPILGLQYYSQIDTERNIFIGGRRSGKKAAYLSYVRSVQTIKTNA